MLKYKDQIDCSLIRIQCSNETFKRPSERLKNYCSKSLSKKMSRMSDSFEVKQTIEVWLKNCCRVL